MQPARPIVGGGARRRVCMRDWARPLRWFGRRGPGLPWQLLKSDTVGEFSEIAACLLLANRSRCGDGAAARRFRACGRRDRGDAAGRGAGAGRRRRGGASEALDRICADLDVQIGITVLKTDGAMIPGTRLRGIAEAAGFRLADGGRFDWIQEETGSVLYALAELSRRSRSPWTRCRATSTPAPYSCSTSRASRSRFACATR